MDPFFSTNFGAVWFGACPTPVSGFALFSFSISDVWFLLGGPEFAISRGQEENMGLHHHQPDHFTQNLLKSNLLVHQTLSGRFPEVLGPWGGQERLGSQTVMK